MTHALLALLLGMGSWTSSAQDSALTLPEPWQPGQTAPIDGAELVLLYPSLDLHLALRALPEPSPAVLERALLKAEERAALSPDRLARSIERDSPGTQTHFLGPSEQGPHLGRWVYQDADGERLYWQVIWRTGGGDWYQILAFAPLDSAAPVSSVMRAVEAKVSVTTTPPPALLAKKVKNTCPADAHFSRAESIAGSKAMAQAREVLLAQDGSAQQTAIGELRLMGLLYRSTEACLRQTLESFPACTVYEAPARSPQDHVLLQAVRDCVDSDSTLSEGLHKVLLP